SAHKVVMDAAGKGKYLHNVDVPASGAGVRLRLIRAGEQVRFLVAEDGQVFKTIQTVEIGTADVTKVQGNCSTMYDPIALDARLTELAIRADQLRIPKQPAVAASSAAGPEKGESNGWLGAVELLGLALALAVAAAVGVGLYWRHNRQADRA